MGAGLDLLSCVLGSWFTDDSCFVTVGTGGLTLWKGVNTAGKALAYTKVGR